MTLGPFFPREFAKDASDLVRGSSGEVIEITGVVTELDGKPLDNVILEIWQADAAGRFDNPGFSGWGRAATDAQGVYRFRTLRPGAAQGRAPHVNFLILYSGLMRQLDRDVLQRGARPGPERGERKRTSDRQAVGQHLSLRHPPARRRRNPVLR